MVLSNTKSLLIVTAAMELGIGIPLLIAPSLTAELLLGGGLRTPESTLVGRIAGAALLSLGLICWLERNRDRSGRALGLVVGLVVYNSAVVALLMYAAVLDGMRGLGIWPAFGLHAALLIWCAISIRQETRR